MTKESWVEASDQYEAATLECDADKILLHAELAIAAALVGITIELGKMNNLLTPISHYIQYRAETEMPMYEPFED